MSLGIDEEPGFAFWPLLVNPLVKPLILLTRVLLWFDIAWTVEQPESSSAKEEAWEDDSDSQSELFFANYLERTLTLPLNMTLWRKKSAWLRWLTMNMVLPYLAGFDPVSLKYFTPSSFDVHYAHPLYVYWLTYIWMSSAKPMRDLKPAQKGIQWNMIKIIGMQRSLSMIPIF